MPRALLSGFRVRVLNDNGRPYGSQPLRIAFFDGGTTSPKSVYSGPLTSDSALGITVQADATGYFPAAGIWLDVGTYHLLIQKKIASTGVDAVDWLTLWTLDDVPGGTADSSVSDSSIRFFDNIAELRGAEGGGLSYVTGYYNIADGGQGAMRWISTSTQDDDGGAWYKPTSYSTSAPGRWERIMPTSTEVDARWWGMGIAQGDNTSFILRAMEWCARTANDSGNTLAFPAGVYPLGSIAGLTLECSGLDLSGNAKHIRFHMYQNFAFSAPAGTVTLTGPCTIDSTSPILFGGATLVVTDATATPFVRPEWVPGSDYGSQIEAACVSGVPVRVLGSYTYARPVTFGAKIILEDTGSLTGSAGGVVFQGGVAVEGTDRQALTLTGGTIQVCMNTIEARWFGWGSTAGNDQGPALDIAIQVASTSGAVLHVNQLPSPKCISSHVLSAAAYPSSPGIKVDGELLIRNGCKLYIPSLIAERRQVFNISGTDAVMVSLGNSIVYPEWFGAQGNGSSDDTAPLKHAVESLYSYPTPGGVRWVTGNGAVYHTTDTTYVSQNYVGLRDLTLLANTTGAAALHYTASGRLYGNRLRNVTISHTNGGDRYPALSLEDLQDFQSADCGVICTNSYGLYLKNSSNMIFNDCQFSMSDDSYFMGEDTAGTLSDSLVMKSCRVAGLSATNNIFLSPNLSKYTDTVFVGGSTTGRVIIAGPAGNNNSRTTVDLDNCTFLDVYLDVSQYSHVKVTNCGRGTTSSVIRFKPLSTNVGVDHTWVHHNDIPTILDLSAGSYNMDPAVFLCYCSCNHDDSTVRTHGNWKHEETLAERDLDRLMGFFPGAPIISFHMDMLSTNQTSWDVIHYYGYNPVCTAGIAEHAYGTADSSGYIFVKTTNATWNHDDTGPAFTDGSDWIQWSCQIATSLLGWGV